jgi:hypothetical protein
MKPHSTGRTKTVLRRSVSGRLEHADAMQECLDKRPHHGFTG